jgi:hypothetical protein
VSRGLLEKLRAMAAKENHRSLNAEIEYRLTKQGEAEEAKKTGNLPVWLPR